MPEYITHSKKTHIFEIQKLANEIREDILDMLYEAQSGHTAGAMGTAEIFASLYFHLLNVDPKNPQLPERDRVILSNGHICPVWYATLARKGFFPKAELKKLRKLGSILQGHPTKGFTPGVEATSGSLAQGLSVAAGMALCAKVTNQNYRTYCISGDGELAEGQIWEAAMFAANKKLHNLTWIIDRNNIQIDGHTEDIMPLENLREKLESFNWYVIEIDGHNVEEIISACKMAQSISERPTVIIAHTIPGKGVDFMEYKFEWHGKTPSKEEMRQALRKLRTLEGKIKSDYD